MKRISNPVQSFDFFIKRRFPELRNRCFNSTKANLIRRCHREFQKLTAEEKKFYEDESLKAMTRKRHKPKTQKQRSESKIKNSNKKVKSVEFLPPDVDTTDAE